MVCVCICLTVCLGVKILIYECTNPSFREEFFRTEFEQIGEVRSLISSHVHVMALTGTAIKCAITKVFTILGLLDPKIITKT